jgi:hypothetical protein
MEIKLKKLTVYYDQDRDDLKKTNAKVEAELRARGLSRREVGVIFVMPKTMGKPEQKQLELF